MCSLLPRSQVHFQSLTSIGEDIKSYFSSFTLEVCDELLQHLDLVHLGADVGDLLLVLELLDQGPRVLDNEGSDGQEWK